MGKLDILTKEYMKRPSIFADVFNQYIYKGCQVILPDRLVELDTTEIVIPYGGGQASVPVQKYRDVSKMLTAMTDGRAAYCILVQHFLIPHTLSTRYLRHRRVVVSQQCHRIASFLRLALTNISSTKYMGIKKTLY